MTERTTPVVVAPLRAYQDLYARLVDLCEREPELGENAHLCVMEAFNTLTEIDDGLPTRLPESPYGPVADVLAQARGLLTDLVAGSTDLATALAFIRVDACIEAAIERQR